MMRASELVKDEPECIGGYADRFKRLGDELR